MRPWRLLAFAAVLVTQVLFVATMAVGEQQVLDEGEQVTLATRPVDPRDLFRGDYVRLAYDIGVLDMGIIAWEAPSPVPEQVVWVVLDDDGAFHRAVAVVPTMDFVEGVAVRGVVEDVSGDIVSVRYGIEEYFIPEGRGFEIEQAGSVDVVVAVSGDGKAVIDHLIVDGEPWS